MKNSEITQKDRKVRILFLWDDQPHVLLESPYDFTKGINEAFRRLAHDYPEVIGDSTVKAAVVIFDYDSSIVFTAERIRWLAGISPDSKDPNWMGQ